MNKIYIVNRSTYDDIVGKSWYYSTKEYALIRFEHYRNLYKDDETYEVHNDDAFSVDGLTVVIYDVTIDDDLPI